ncbi:hypothetical protein D9C73_021058 [Collichthys lucidus]|uniref:Uncharacterized protein n=1 Tax=Collichthys lucidus TaxID=240159 RepID=A0A4U5VFE9_COLLU|nr:hypothetical protein D9C73_021058 [Collichthys lucidus]
MTETPTCPLCPNRGTPEARPKLLQGGGTDGGSRNTVPRKGLAPEDRTMAGLSREEAFEKKLANANRGWVQQPDLFSEPVCEVKCVNFQSESRDTVQQQQEEEEREEEEVVVEKEEEEEEVEKPGTTDKQQQTPATADILPQALRVMRLIRRPVR